MTNRELFFKCSGMPFVKIRIDMRDITDVLRIKNYKHRLQTVLSIETKQEQSYVFYKFRLPRSMMRSLIMQQVAQAKGQSNEFEAGLSHSDTENIHVLRLKKIRMPFQNFASMIRTSFNGN